MRLGPCCPALSTFSSLLVLFGLPAFLFALDILYALFAHAVSSACLLPDSAPPNCLLQGFGTLLLKLLPVAFVRCPWSLAFSLLNIMLSPYHIMHSADYGIILTLKHIQRTWLCASLEAGLVLFAMVSPVSPHRRC